MIEYGKYHILEGIYPHIGLHIGLLADGNIHNINLIYRYNSNNDHPVKTLLIFSGYEGRFFYVRREVDLMKTAKVNAYIMHIFGKIELLSIHAT